MMWLLAFAALAWATTTSAQAMPIAPVHEPGIIMQIASGCGVSRTRVHGVCVASTTIRHARRCVRWRRGVCGWRYN